MQRTAHMPDGTNGEGPNRRSGLLHVRQTEAMCPQIQHVSLHGVYENRMADTQVSMVSDHVAQKRLLKSGKDRKRFPALGNRITSRGQSKCQPRVLEVPAAGTRSASRRESNSQPLGIVFPALGNQIPSLWESCSQPLGIVFPALGNRIPSPWEWHCLRQKWGGW